MNRKGFMLVISSPSGAGKTSIVKNIFKNDRDLVSSVSVTTRKPREGEIDGVDYYFVSKERFEEMINNGDFLEHANVFGHYYGTTERNVKGCLEKGIDVVFDIDWQGHKQLLSKAKEEVVSVFVLPPSMEELKRRLYKRGLDTTETIEYRMHRAANEIAKWELYDYVVINHNLQDSANAVMNIVKAERFKRSRQVRLDDFVDLLVRKRH
ncbi:Guanylate kinase [Candidatus Xenohaliotis californiensis]|uniref:Guanylate kinase n=1 Tax=Candidatus Xenohaliotis californiensis TaxID=84677 RepID=A0ABM9N804_9RICK|nr:Guanylate kinase [Candidatus Xenohaliotis californiensis]